MRKIILIALLSFGITVFAETAPDANAGAKIYKNYCSTCHATGSGGAPRLKDKVKWVERLKKDNQILIKEALNGYKLMPPKGNCYKCNDEDIANAVAYIRSQAGK